MTVAKTKEQLATLHTQAQIENLRAQAGLWLSLAKLGEAAASALLAFARKI